MVKTLGYSFVKAPEGGSTYKKLDLNAYKKHLGVMSTTLIEGGEIPFTYHGTDYRLKIICGVPEWFNTESNQIAPCSVQTDIYGNFETNQDEFWKVFGKVKKGVNGAQAAQRNNIERVRKGDLARVRSLSRFLNGSFSPKEKKDIVYADPDADRIYDRMSKSNSRSLARQYKGNMELLISDIKKLKVTNKDRSKK